MSSKQRIEKQQNELFKKVILKEISREEYEKKTRPLESSFLRALIKLKRNKQGKSDPYDYVGVVWGEK